MTLNGIPERLRPQRPLQLAKVLLRSRPVLTVFATALLLAILATPLARAESCELNSLQGRIQHIIYVQFDNVHFTRDNPNVPSDLEQMPNLLNFLESNGTLLTDHHTPLVSHTADDILTSLTGVYGSRHGQPVANSFDYFTPTGANFISPFQYWTDIVDPTLDPTYFMLTANGQNAPAPWVPYTQAGCNVGAVSTANIELENIGSDINNVFGPNSPEAREAKTNFRKAIADFEGIAIHCAAGDSVCSSANGGEPDVLPQEPGSYNGFNALFGNAFVASAPAVRSPIWTAR